MQDGTECSVQVGNQFTADIQKLDESPHSPFPHNGAVAGLDVADKGLI